MGRDIFAKLAECNAIITPENETKVDQDFREYAGNRFEKFFGAGSCEKVFCTQRPSYKAFEQFFDKMLQLIKQWSEK